MLGVIKHTTIRPVIGHLMNIFKLKYSLCAIGIKRNVSNFSKPGIISLVSVPVNVGQPMLGK